MTSSLGWIDLVHAPFRITSLCLFASVISDKVAIGLGSMRKLHRIPPLHNILHLFALVDLVDQVRGMIEQSCCFSGSASPA